MKKLFLLVILAIIFVSCTDKSMDENSRTTGDTTNFKTSDNAMMPENGTSLAPIPNAEAPANTDNKISLEDAKKIAFEDAGVNEADIMGLDTNTEREGSRRYYEIDFKAGGYEYEYDIDIESGKILKRDKEID